MSAATDTASTHGAQMDAIYGLQRHVYDLTRKYYLLGRDRLIAELDLPEGGSVLEVGCGTARNLAVAAKTWSRAEFCGIDISAEMLKSARNTLKKQGLHADLAIADAAQFDSVALFGRGEFDRVIFSYTLSMIPPWQQALDHACSLLASGGSLHVVDFGRQDCLPRWWAKAFLAYLAQFHVTPRAELFSAGSELAERYGLQFEAFSPFRDYSRMMTLRRY